MAISNTQIANIFTDMAALLEIKGESVFKVRAYQRAANTIENLEDSLEGLVHAKSDLKQISGIGKAINDKIYEYVETSHISAYERLLDELPEGVLTLMTVPYIGPKTAYLVATQLGIKSLQELEGAILDKSLLSIDGIGDRTCQIIHRSLGEMRVKDRRTPIGEALSIAESIIEQLEAASDDIVGLYIAGSLRRWEETIGDIDLIAVCGDPEKLLKVFTRLDCVAEVLVLGDKKTSVIIDSGIQVDLRVSDTAALGAMVQYFTGSQQHNIRLRDYARTKGLSVNEYGITDVITGTQEMFSNETAFYNRLGLSYIPPELRLGLDEVDWAQNSPGCELITEADLKGDLHVHTDWSDGSDSTEVMIQTASDLGYGYIAITDHSAGLGVARGLSVDRLRDRILDIRKLQEKFSIRIFIGSEVDIRADGTLDYPDDLLDELDIVVASVHSAMGQDSEVMTRRLISAMNHQSVTIIGHLTTRIIGQRPSIQCDIERILGEAKRTGTILEINSSPERLDLKDTHARLAKQMGVPLVVNTDSHDKSGFLQRKYGIAVARRAGCLPTHVVNTMGVDRFSNYVSSPKPDRDIIFSSYTQDWNS